MPGKGRKILEQVLTVEEFEEFYAHAASRLTGQLYVMLGDLHEAQDVVQEAFVRGWSRRRQLSGTGSPEAWIRTVAWRLAVSRWRGRRRSDEAWQRHGGPPPVEGPGPGPVALVSAIRELSPRQRRTVVLHYVCDLSVDQIAAETGLSSGTVKTHLSRGRAALAGRLQDPRETGDPHDHHDHHDSHAEEVPGA
ncbi:SigE family RNA polymerase sigma factor [Streptomyces sp. H10-C2]|uniref:SigE family RNA polymerase sigma factor n=1 Tax=unclassified Streptomyces TaxID=2593676 RepID=UPI0024B89A43|nr:MULTISPECIES: SigE family RNA polymerase sigma factor [unclassified Streptomyces]MDJ0342131.1 SigE family RNA polymerase sigma factor [Streptomyces sp. PH10-H1]MDJ0368473.1 SigE family RNA polymerase sigma factor [Streptomyces sp. H10-C2]